ncbi:MAG: Na(+)-translocating NADH-quinone reductase subunit C [Pseudomonadales bacterium]|nr:Na(+)-translocating NADH-quinone reductase subunit C [Pseudomonadales bacterium]
MARNNDTISKILTVTLLLCVVCSIIVSSAAVILKPQKEANIAIDRMTNILAAAGLYKEDVDIHEQFANVDTRVVDLTTGQFTSEVDPAIYDQRKAAKTPADSVELNDTQDIAKIGRREKFSLVYIINDDQGELSKLILPVRGYGLWSTLHGFIALDADLNTVAGLGFYEHGETPGLGGEVDNPKWKALWPGKRVRDKNNAVSLHLVKGRVDTDKPGSEYQVDGLSGATLTSKGVSNLVRFWMGENGFGPFLTNLKNEEVK